MPSVLAAAGSSPRAYRGALVHVAASIRVRLARATARRTYRRMLALDDEALRRIGVTREDVRLALLACGGGC